MNGEAGKGDTYRSVNWKAWDEGWERAFGTPKQETHEPTADKAAKDTRCPLIGCNCGGTYDHHADTGTKTATPKAGSD